MAVKPFTVDHFERYVSNLVLDSGDYWRLEDFQAEVVEPILDAVRWRMLEKNTGGYEIWTIIPEGNAKTTLMAGVGLYLTDYTPLPWIPIGASSRDQAEILATQAYQMIRASPGMLQRFHIYEGYRRVQPIRGAHPGRGDRGMKVHAADIGTNDGVIPFPIAICDEGHRHPDMSLYRLWKGKCRKRGSSIVMISTAGEPGTEFEEMRDTIRDRMVERKVVGAHLRGKAGKVILNEWRTEPTKVTDMAEVKRANPLSIITEETLEEDYTSPTMDIGSWKRLKCNIPARSSNAAVSEQEYEEMYTKLRPEPGEHVDLGVDVAWKHDTFAIVPIWQTKADGKIEKPKGKNLRVLLEPSVMKTPRDGTMLPIDDVKIAFESMFTSYSVDTIVMDMTRAEDTAAWLEAEFQVKIIDWPQGPGQAAKDYEEYMKALRNGTLKQTGSSVLRAHTMHAIARPLPGDKRRFDRPAQSRNSKLQEERVIDALAAAYMLNSWMATRPAPLDLDDYRVGTL